MTAESVDLTIRCDDCGIKLTIPEVSHEVRDPQYPNGYRVVMIDEEIFKELLIGLGWVRAALTKHYCPSCAFGEINGMDGDN
jgi:hypothetical protein